jgi:ABC-2 type transport system ATP-binding protein
LELRMENHQKGIKFLEKIETLRNLVLSGDKIHILVDDAYESERVIRGVLKSKGMEILSLTVVRPSLEDAFVSIVREKRK